MAHIVASDTARYCSRPTVRSTQLPPVRRNRLWPQPLPGRTLLAARRANWSL